MAPLLLKMDLDAGHFSASDRYALLRELAVGCEYLSPPPAPPPPLLEFHECVLSDSVWLQGRSFSTGWCRAWPRVQQSKWKQRQQLAALQRRSCE